MRKSYSLRNTNAGFLSPPKWRTSLILLCSLLHFLGLSAQTTVQIGAIVNPPTTTVLQSSTYGPIRATAATPTNQYSRHWYLYTATEMTAAGIPSGSTITKIEWYKNNNAVVATNSGALNIYMNNSNLTNVGMGTGTTWTTASTGATLVATKIFDNGANNFPAAFGWVEFPVTSFTYTGNSFEILTDWNAGNPVMTLTTATAAYAGTTLTQGLPWLYNNGLTANSALGGSGTAAGGAPASLTSAFGGVNRPIIKITYNPPAGCSGTPTAGTASAPATACSGANFTANLTGQATGAGITLQWESAPDVAGVPGTWTPIAAATSSAVTTSLTAKTWYRCVVTCTNSSLSSTSNEISVDLAAAVNCYCTSTATATTSSDVGQVTISTLTNPASAPSPINNNASANKTYTSFTGLTAPDLMQGNAYPLTITQITDGATFTQCYAKVFIDFNRDGDYIDAGEEVFSQFGPATTATPAAGPHFTGTVTVPIGASVGVTGMRVVLKEGGAAANTTSCGTYTNGETEDYAVNIIAAPACSGAPAASTTNSTLSSVCQNNPFTLSLATTYGATGISYQWQSASAAAGPYTNIAGAINNTYTVANQTTSTWYQCVITCANSGLSTTSTSLNVAQNPFYECYCSPTTSVTLHTLATNCVTNVAVGTINNASTASCAMPAYTLYPTATATTSMAQNSSQSITVNTTLATSNIGLWVDYNRNGTFDATEYTAVNTTPSANGTVSFTVPAAAQTGLTGLRVRTSAAALTSADACATLASGETEDYIITITGPQPCTGTPSAATAISSVAAACPSANFNLSLSNTYGGITGITYQWQSASAAAGPYTNIAGATSATLTTSLTATTYYQCVITCSGSGQSVTSSNVMVTANAPTTCYCTPTHTTGTGFGDFITLVQLGTINNATGASATPFYTFYNALSTNLTVGNPYTLTLSAGTYTVNDFAAWIDWNADGDWVDAGELLGTINNLGAGPATGTITFTVPPGASIGATRMRVRESDTGTGITDPCAALTWGETEDYMVNIQAAPNCTGTPNAGTIPASFSLCAGASTATITPTGLTYGTTMTYTWEESDDNGVTDPWGPVVGGSVSATLAYTTPMLISAKYYRLKSFCASSNQTAISNVCAITTYICTYDVVRTTNNTYNSIMSTGTAYTFQGTSGDDNTTTTVTIPFTFIYKGQTVTGFRACTNGWMSFNTTTTSTSFGSNLSIDPPNQVLAPFWEDLVLTGNNFANAANCMKYAVTGTAPNRVMIAEWAGIETFGNAGPNLNFQVKLYETSNNIEFCYGALEGFDGTQNYTYSHAIGLNGTTPAVNSLADRMILQEANTNYFTATSVTNLATVPVCYSKYTWTSGIYTGTAPVATPPANDEPAQAILVPTGTAPCVDLCGTYYTSRNATATGTVPTCSAATPGTADDDVFFKFNTLATPSLNYLITVRGSGGYNPVVQVLDATYTPIAGTNCVNATGNGLTETITVNGLPANTTYYVRVYSEGAGWGTSGDFSICVNQVLPPPTNDDPCPGLAPVIGATSLTPGTTCVYTASESPATLSATATAGIPTCSTNPDDDVWYSFVANIPNPVITVQSGPGYNAAVQLLSATGTCPTLTFTSLNCVNLTSTAGIETINATGLTPGQTYYVRVFHSGIGTGNANFTICVTATPPTCPTGTFTPANNAVNQSPAVTLTWPASAGAAGYNVYLGTTTPPTTIVSTNQAGTTYTPPANLNQNTQYYWSIIPVNAVGSPATCSVQNFTTMFLDDASLTGLTLSNVCPGTTAATVSVTLNNNGFNPIAIGAATVVLTVSGANTGTYSWTNTAALTSITNTVVNFTTVNLANSGTNNFSAQVYYAPDGNLPNNTVTGTANTVTLAGGTTTAPSAVCSAASFALNLSGTNVPSTGVTYQWQSAAAAAGPWTNIAGATTVPYTVATGQTAATFYQCVITGCATTVNSTPVQVAMNPATLCYCIPPHTAGCNASDISNVAIVGTTLNNTTTCTVNGGTAYTAYPATGNTTANLQIGSTYQLSVTTTGTINSISSVWIDYNQNGLFETTEWQQIATAAAPNVATTINITIPPTALIGQTGMRIRSRYQGNVNGAGDACTSMGSGEAEDYIVNIINCPYSPTASITPTGSTTPACSPATVLLTATAIAANTSPVYQWVRNGVNITGANSATYTATQQGFYYVKITDATAPGCGTATSNTTTVNISPAPSGVTATASASAICLPAAPLTLTGTGTISSVGALFSENWTSNSFATQGWTFDPAQPNWTMGTQYTPTGGAAPNAFFNWTPSMTNYSVSLVSPIINATGATNITMDYLLQMNNFSVATLEEFEVAYKATTAASWTVLETFNNAAGTANFARTAQPMAVAGQNFQVRFRAYGANSFNINGWGLDNIVINGTIVPIYSWTSTPAGYTANVLNPAAFTPTAGTTGYTLTITDPQNGCSTAANVPVTVGNAPAPSTLTITTPKYPGCNNSVDVQVSGGNPSNNFYWYTNATHTGTPVLSGTNGTISISPLPGTQTHWVFEVDASGTCFGSSTSAPISTVGPIPTDIPDLTGGVTVGSYKSYFANAACIDGSGWTHYYYDAPGAGTDVIILSTNEGGHDFGTLALDSLLSPTAHYFVRADVVPGYGSGQGQHVTQATTGDITPPEYPYDPYWFIMNRSWILKHDASHTPTSPMPVRSYFSSTDFSDVQGSLTASGAATTITSPNDLFFFKISTGNDVVPSHGHAGVNDTEIAVYNNTTVAPSVATPLVTGVYGQPTGTWYLGSTSASTYYGEMVVPNFSGGGGGAAPTSPLPVTLLDFAGRSENGVNLLNWTTSSERNNDYFEVMRSLDNAAYETVGKVDTKAPNGNSSTPLTYDYTDTNPNAQTLYYRLKQVDLNGKFRYSNAIQLSMNGDFFAAMDAFPNPTSKELNISVSAPVNNKMVVEVYDVYGRVLIQQNYVAAGGQEIVKLNVEKLAAGTYTVRVRSKSSDFHAATNFVKIND